MPAVIDPSKITLSDLLDSTGGPQPQVRTLADLAGNPVTQDAGTANGMFDPSARAKSLDLAGNPVGGETGPANAMFDPSARVQPQRLDLAGNPAEPLPNVSRTIIGQVDGSIPVGNPIVADTSKIVADTKALSPMAKFRATLSGAWKGLKAKTGYTAVEESIADNARTLGRGGAAEFTPEAIKEAGTLGKFAKFQEGAAGKLGEMGTVIMATQTIAQTGGDLIAGRPRDALADGAGGVAGIKASQYAMKQTANLTTKLTTKIATKLASRAASATADIAADLGSAGTATGELAAGGEVAAAAITTGEVAADVGLGSAVLAGGVEGGEALGAAGTAVEPGGGTVVGGALGFLGGAAAAFFAYEFGKKAVTAGVKAVTGSESDDAAKAAAKPKGVDPAVAAYVDQLPQGDKDAMNLLVASNQDLVAQLKDPNVKAGLTKDDINAMVAQGKDLRNSLQLQQAGQIQQVDPSQSFSPSTGMALTGQQPAAAPAAPDNSVGATVNALSAADKQALDMAGTDPAIAAQLSDPNVRARLTTADIANLVALGYKMESGAQSAPATGQNVTGGQTVDPTQPVAPLGGPGGFGTGPGVGQ